MAFLRRWPDLISLKAARPGTIKRFYYQHQVRSETLVEERLALIAVAVALTTEEARVCVARLQLAQLLAFLGRRSSFSASARAPAPVPGRQ